MKQAIRKWLGVSDPVKKKKHKRSTYAGAKNENVLSSWIFAATDVNEILRGELGILRTRSRDLFKNNFLVKGFSNQAEIHCLGQESIKLQAKVVKQFGPDLDEPVNNVLETNWNEFRNNCDVTGRGGLHECDSQILRCLLRDGEAFVMRQKGWTGNRFRYGVKVVDPCLVDDQLKKTMSNGNVVVNGVELDDDGRAVAYHLKDPKTTASNNHKRVDAKELLHVFVQDEPGQTRGVPWIAAAMVSLKHLDGFMEAAVVNARATALAMGFLETTGDEEADLDEGDGPGDDGDAVWNMEAGVIRQLPAGRKFTGTNFGFPDAAMESFTKTIAKAITASLPGSYASIAGDIENASWSALRNDEIRAKSSWACVQRFFIRQIRKVIWEDWLEQSLLAGQIKLGEKVVFGLGDFDRLNRPMWFPPVYPSADEIKRQNANKIRLELKTASRREIIAEEGKDIADVDADIASDKNAAGFDLEGEGEGEVDGGGVDGSSDTNDYANLKTQLDAYSVGVRAGAITPSIDDENAFRIEAGLPPITADARKAWNDDGGVRRPITLKAQGQFKAESVAAENAAGSDDSEEEDAA